MKRFILALAAALSISYAALASHSPKAGEEGQISFFCTTEKDMRAAIDAVKANDRDALRALLTDGSCASTRMMGVEGLPVTVIEVVGEYGGFYIVKVKFADGSEAYTPSNKD